MGFNTKTTLIVLAAMFILYSTTINVLGSAPHPTPEVEGYYGGYEILGKRALKSRYSFLPGRLINSYSSIRVRGKREFRWGTSWLGWADISPSKAKRNAHNYEVYVKGMGIMPLSKSLGSRRSDEAESLHEDVRSAKINAERANAAAKSTTRQLRDIDMVSKSNRIAIADKGFFDK